MKRILGKRKHQTETEKQFPCQKALEWGMVLFLMLSLFFSILVENGVITLYPWMLQKTGNDNIYQILVQVQAAMVGIVVAIVALLTNIVDSQTYGLSTARFIMTLRPIFPFRYRSIVIEVILLTALNWVMIALGLFNISVVLFFITTSLLSYLAADVMKVMYSRQLMEEKIYWHILTNKNIDEVNNLFNELNESIIKESIIVFKRDIKLLKGLMPIFISPSTSKIDLDKFLEQLLALIKTTNETRFSNIADIIDLYITAFETANEAEGGIILLNDMGSLEVDELLSKAPKQALIGLTSNLLLFRWHKALLINSTMREEEWLRRKRGNVASHLYHCLCKTSRDDFEEVNLSLLKDAQLFYEGDSISKHISEDNYLSFVMTLFAKQDKRLLDILFGFDGRLMGFFFSPIVRNYTFHMNRANSFIVLYTYYLAYLEKLNKPDDNLYFRGLLDKAAKPFWDCVQRNAEENEQLFSSDIKDDFLWFTAALRMYEFHPDLWYGISTVKTLVYEDVVLDFFAFSLAHSLMSTLTIERNMKHIISTTDTLNRMSAFRPLKRYAISDALERYRRFCTVMENEYRQSNLDEEYERLRTAVTNIYREEQISESKSDNEMFASKQNGWEQHFTTLTKETAILFSSEFKGSCDTPIYKLYKVATINTPLQNGELPISDREFGDLFSRSLKLLFYWEIRRNLVLSQVSIDKLTVTDFMDRIAGIDADMIIGIERFPYNDPEYNVYNEFKVKCKDIEVYAEKVHAAINSRLINVSIRNVGVKIDLPDDEYIRNEISQNSAMTVNEHSIKLDNETAVEYLRNSRRIITIEIELAVTCLNDVIGRGFQLENTQY